MTLARVGFVQRVFSPVRLVALAALCYGCSTYASHPALAPTPVAAGEHDPVQVTLAPQTVRSIDGFDAFDRTKYITLHGGNSEGDMSPEDHAFILEELDARYGRDGGIRTHTVFNTPAHPKRAGFPDVKSIRKAGREAQRERAARPGYLPEMTRQTVLCAHPEHLLGREGNEASAWGPTTPEAAAEFEARFMKHFWTDEERPLYFEVFNEPFVKAKKIGTTVEAFSEQHVAVARRMRKLAPQVQVGGYSAAWIEVEAGNFRHWENNQKKFMDIAGAEMDFFSYHIYDGINVTGEARNRTGSNSEAILDLIDQYSWLSFGRAKPQMITEYGLIPAGNMGNLDYSAERSAQMIRSTQAQMLTFMDHPDRLLKTVPFFLGKALWTYGLKGPGEPGKANPFLLWRRLADGSFVKTDLVKFYRFWLGVDGQHRWAHSNDPDVRVHVWADQKRLNVVLMNIEDHPRTVGLEGLQDLDAAGVHTRRLTTHGSAPELSETPLDGVPATLTLAPGESVLLMIDSRGPLKPQQTVLEERVYADSYMKPIEAGTPLRFVFDQVPAGEGRATLRVSAGRANDRTKIPTSVTVNGEAVPVPTDWAGDEQAGRSMFFGALEVDVPRSLLQARNTVEVTYADAGGKLACVVLRLETLQP